MTVCFSCQIILSKSCPKITDLIWITCSFFNQSMIWPGDGILIGQAWVMGRWGSILPVIHDLGVRAWVFPARSWNDSYKRSYLVLSHFTDKRTQNRGDFSFLLSHNKIIISRTGFFKVILHGNITHTELCINTQCTTWWIVPEWIYPCNHHPHQEIEHYPEGLNLCPSLSLLSSH